MDLSISNNAIYNFLKEHNLSTNSKFIVDRFVENFAICENKETGSFLDIPKNYISSLVKPGNIIKLENGLFVPDNEAYLKEVEEIKSLANSVFKKKK